MLLSLQDDEILVAVRSAVAAAGGVERLSPAAWDFLGTVVGALPGGPDVTELLDAVAVPGEALALRYQARHEVIRTAVVLAMLGEDPTIEDYGRLMAWRDALAVTEPAVAVIGAIASGEVGLDLVRTVEFDAYRTPVPRELALLPAYSRFLTLGLPAAAVHGTVADARLAGLFAAMADLPAGTAGRTFVDFYGERGWRMPGTAGGVALPLTLHDWLHVYIGVGTEPLGEVEVGAFACGTARHRDGFHNLLIVLLMFEYGMVAAMPGGPGLAPEGAGAGRALDRDRGRGVSGQPEGGRAVAESLLRGRATNTDLYLGVDHLGVAAQPLATVRERFGVPARGARPDRADIRRVTLAPG